VTPFHCIRTFRYSCPKVFCRLNGPEGLTCPLFTDSQVCVVPLARRMLTAVTGTLGAAPLEPQTVEPWPARRPIRIPTPERLKLCGVIVSVALLTRSGGTLQVRVSEVHCRKSTNRVNVTSTMVGSLTSSPSAGGRTIGPGLWLKRSHSC